MHNAECLEIERAVAERFSVSDCSPITTIKFAKAFYGDGKVKELAAAVIESIKSAWPSGTQVIWRKRPEITEHEIGGRKLTTLTCRIGSCATSFK